MHPTFSPPTADKNNLNYWDLGKDYVSVVAAACCYNLELVAAACCEDAREGLPSSTFLSRRRYGWLLLSLLSLLCETAAPHIVGELDDTAMDVNFSGNLSFDKIMQRRFDIKWIAPKAEGSFSDARGDILISHDYITVNSSSAAFELTSKIQTSYLDEYWLSRIECGAKSVMPFIVDGLELDLRMRGFEFFSLISSYPFDSPRPTHLKATGRIKFQGNVLKPSSSTNEHNFGFEKNNQLVEMSDKGKTDGLVGEVLISGLKLNQLMLAPQLVGQLSISRECIKLDATGRPDESLTVEVVRPLQPSGEDNLQNGKLMSFSLQKGQLRANVCFRPLHSANLEVRNLPLDELELASLRGTLQRAEIQLNLQKRRGHGVLSVLRPKFSGVLGEALDVAARWSGDVITVEKTVLELSNYELQGEYVLPGTRDRSPAGKERGGLLKRAMAGHLGSVISSMGRWRMRLEVPRAEVAEMLPLARLLSRSTDPAVHSRSKDLFLQSLQSVGLYPENIEELLEVIRGHYTSSNEVILEDLSLPGLGELKGRWHGSLDASGGGNGDTMVDIFKSLHTIAIGLQNQFTMTPLPPPPSFATSAYTLPHHPPPSPPYHPLPPLYHPDTFQPPPPPPNLPQPLFPPVPITPPPCCGSFQTQPPTSRSTLELSCLQNQHGRFVELFEYHGGAQRGGIRVPERYQGTGWEKFAKELESFFLGKQEPVGDRAGNSRNGRNNLDLEVRDSRDFAVHPTPLIGASIPFKSSSGLTLRVPRFQLNPSAPRPTPRAFPQTQDLIIGPGEIILDQAQSSAPPEPSFPSSCPVDLNSVKDLSSEESDGELLSPRELNGLAIEGFQGDFPQSSSVWVDLAPKDQESRIDSDFESLGVSLLSDSVFEVGEPSQAACMLDPSEGEDNPSSAFPLVLVEEPVDDPISPLVCEPLAMVIPLGPTECASEPPPEPSRRVLVANQLLVRKVPVSFAETKLVEVDLQLVRSLWGNSFVGREFLPAVGSADGVLTLG
uniref:Uncharacterized protein n=1 Tax=Fagus sylvatica TaxID=28930 RepID=A0A2N9EEG8_FAGSY